MNDKNFESQSESILL